MTAADVVIPVLIDGAAAGDYLGEASAAGRPVAGERIAA